MRSTSVTLMFLMILHCFVCQSKKMQSDNYASVFCGDDYTNIFKIPNNTSSKILVYKVRPLCSCIEISEYSSEIAAWSTGKVASILKTSKLNGKTDYKIMVQTSSKENPLKTLNLKVNVIRDLVIHPSEAIIGKIARGAKPLPIKIEIYSRTGKELFKPELINLPSCLESEITKKDKKYEIELKFIKAPPVGNLNVSVQIKASNEREGAYFFKIKGRVDPVFH